MGCRRATLYHLLSMGCSFTTSGCGLVGVHFEKVSNMLKLLILVLTVIVEVLTYLLDK